MIQVKYRKMETFSTRIRINVDGQKTFTNCQIKLELLVNSVVK